GQPKGQEQQAGQPGGDSKPSPKGGEKAQDQGRPDSQQAKDNTPARPDAAELNSRQRFTETAKGELQESKANQKAIADELQKMLDGLSEFETYRGVVKDAQNLLKEQEQTIKQGADAASKPELMGKTPDELTQEQKGDLANLAARQSNVSRGLQGLQERMDEMAKRLDESDPLAAAALREAADQSRKQGTSAKMGEAAQRREKTQRGEARGAQEKARQELKDLVDSIQNRRERELARLVKELKNAQSELQKLRQRQAQNLKKTEQAKKIADPKQ